MSLQPAPSAAARSPPPWVIAERRLTSLCCAELPTSCPSHHGSVCVSVLLSQFLPPCASCAVSTSPFFTSGPNSHPADGFIGTIFLDSVHIYALIYDTCFSDRLYSVSEALGSYTYLELTQICSFLWLSNIPFYICTTTF